MCGLRRGSLRTRTHIAWCMQESAAAAALLLVTTAGAVQAVTSSCLAGTHWLSPPLCAGGAIDCFRKTLQWEGVPGLYKGVTSPLAGQVRCNCNALPDAVRVMEVMDSMCACGSQAGPCARCCAAGTAVRMLLLLFTLPCLFTH